MRCKKINNRKQRGIKPLWSFAILVLGLALSGLLSPLEAQVTVCGETLSSPDGTYRLKGKLKCLDDPILYIDEDDAEFDLRGFTATGNNLNTGILIEANNVMIVGGTFRNCYTALEINKKNYCEIKNFKAFDSQDKAIKIRGDGNSIVKSFCENAGNDCFELRGGDEEENSAEWCTAIKSGTLQGGQGFSLRGPTYVYKCTAIGSSAEGFQIQEGVSDVEIEQCHAVNNALSGIAIKAENGDFATDNTVERCLVINNDQGGIVIDDGAINNSIERNTAHANGDGITYFDLSDGNGNCDDNIWNGNKFKTRDQSCIH